MQSLYCLGPPPGVINFSEVFGAAEPALCCRELTCNSTCSAPQHHGAWLVRQWVVRSSCSASAAGRQWSLNDKTLMLSRILYSTCWLPRRLALALAALALAAVHGQNDAAEQESTQDQLVKHLAGVFMTKEGGNIDAARNSMRVFQVLRLRTPHMHLSFAQMGGLMPSL